MNAQGFAGKGTGVFVAVVGPSGAGKDSLLRLAQEMLSGDPAYTFVRRVVTRPENDDESHDTLSDEAFAKAENAGEFAVTWSANGLRYAVPASARSDVMAGRVVIANASREAAHAIKAVFARTIIIHVTASVETLRARLLARGREEADAVEARLARSLMLEQAFTADIRIENNGALETAAKQLLNALAALKPKDPSVAAAAR
jgi:ribose 1,5-bisphosphokinase